MKEPWTPGMLLLAIFLLVLVVMVPSLLLLYALGFLYVRGLPR